MHKENRKRKVLLLGIDASTIDALDNLKRRGIFTIITDYNHPDLVSEKRMADDYWMIDIADVDALEEACKKEGITGVFAGSNEFCLDQCKVLCKRLGLPFYASDLGWKASRDKDYYKELCIQAGLLVPQKYDLDTFFKEEDLRKIKYPVIVKPNDSEGRKGVFLVNNEAELKHFYMKSLDFSATKNVLVEEYIDGDDFLVFGYVHKGKLYPIKAIINHAIEIDGEKRLGFVEHNEAFLENIDRQVLEAYKGIVTELNCENGACLFQGIRKNGLIYNTEFGFRLDGVRCWRTTKRTKGIDYLEWMINLALGEDNTDLVEKGFDIFTNLCLSCAIWGKPGTISRITGKDELYGNNDILMLIDRYEVGDSIPDVSNMSAIVFAFDIFGNTKEEIINRLKMLDNCLHVYDEAGQDLLEHRLSDFDLWD